MQWQEAANEYKIKEVDGRYFLHNAFVSENYSCC